MDHDVPKELDKDDVRVLLTALSYLSIGVAQANRGEVVEAPPEFWPWEPEAWKPESLEKNLVKAHMQINFVLQRIEKYNEAAKKSTPS